MGSSPRRDFIRRTALTARLFFSTGHNKNSVSSRGWRSAPRDLTPAQALARYNRRVLRFRRDGPLCDLIAAGGPSASARLGMTAAPCTDCRRSRNFLQPHPRILSSCTVPNVSGWMRRDNLLSFSYFMANTILIGAQWGDEGKGKIIDFLTAKADIVVRSQGGNNAGHTVIHRGAKYVLHLIPSGILRRGKVCVIGNGVVVDPIALVAEIEGLRKRQVEIGKNLLISDRAHLVLTYHRLLDEQS